MPRNASPLLLLATLTVGVLLGVALDRGGRAVSAQAQAGAAATPEAAVPPTATGTRARAVGEEAIYQELARQYDQFQHVNRTFELVARAVSPAVVHIVARKPGLPREDGRKAHDYEETGSGVIVRPDRDHGLFVLTNSHVIERAAPSEIQIALHDGRVLRPQRFWSDTKADVAVLSLGRDDLPTARLGNSDDVAVGSWVLALGSPFGLTHSVSTGIISARGRHEDELQDDGVENQDFLQTDAAINPGNSGGPLVNMKGEVIGINTAIASHTDGSQGVGFSIPINLARWIMGQLVATGKVSRGAMGINLHREGLSHEKAQSLGLDRPRGAWVLDVYPRSPAAVADIRGGDVILRLNKVVIIDLNHLINLVSMAPIGKAVEVVIRRAGQDLTKRVTIADQESILALAPPQPPKRSAPGGPLRRPPRPAPTPAEATAPSAEALGLELIALDGPLARHLGLSEAQRGVAIVRIDPTSPLASHFQPLDVIATVDGQPARSAEDVARALGRRASRSPIVFGLQRQVDGAMQSHSLRLPR